MVTKRSSHDTLKLPSGESPLTPASVEIGPAHSCRDLLDKVVMTAWKITGMFSLALIMFYNYCGGVVLFALVSLALLAFVYDLQDQLLYYPSQPSHSRHFLESPTSYGLPSESKFIETSDGVKVHVVFMGQAVSRRANVSTVLFLHGNAGNIGHRLQNMRDLYFQCRVNIMMLEYRGYGKSQGTPSEEGLYTDLDAAIMDLINRTDIDISKIVVMGRSLGGGVATSIARSPRLMNKISAVILENTFTSIAEMGASVFGIDAITILPSFYVKNKYESISRIKDLTVPTLFLSGIKDTLVPPKMMYKLYNKSGARLKELVKLDGGHNDSWQADGYYQAIARFLNRVNGG